MRSVHALVCACLLATTACISEDDPSLTVQALSTDVAFGVEVEDPAGQPTLEPSQPLPETAADGGFEPPELQRPEPDDESGPPPLPPVRTTPREECPTAPRTAAAERIATENITELPAEGVYRWKREGTQTLLVPETGDTVEIPIGGFEKRIVQNVTEVSDTEFTFEVVAPLLDRPAVSVTTFAVDTEPTQYQPGGLVVVDEPRANEPEGGVTVKSVVIREEDGSESSFNPVTGLLYLGLPVLSGERFQSSAVDPRTGESTVSEAQVLGRDRIDACGEVADGWRVETTQSRSDASGAVSFNYLVAPQYGGMVIREELQLTDSEGNTIEVTYTLGQLEPDPLPDGAGAGTGDESTDGEDGA